MNIETSTQLHLYLYVYVCVYLYVATSEHSIDIRQLTFVAMLQQLFCCCFALPLLFAVCLPPLNIVVPIRIKICVMLILCIQAPDCNGRRTSASQSEMHVHSGDNVGLHFCGVAMKIP